jgi:3-dehydroquinate dehydratase
VWAAAQQPFKGCCASVPVVDVYMFHTHFHACEPFCQHMVFGEIGKRQTCGFGAGCTLLALRAVMSTGGAG